METATGAADTPAAADTLSRGDQACLSMLLSAGYVSDEPNGSASATRDGVSPLIHNGGRAFVAQSAAIQCYCATCMSSVAWQHVSSMT
eukprot:350771-Chlamydomonas_euryale.AAC.3